MVLILALMLGGLLWSAPAGGEETSYPRASPRVDALPSVRLTQEEMCALIPQDQGFSFAETANDRCFASRGDCDAPGGESRTCLGAHIVAFDSPQQARDALDNGTAVPGFGDAAIEVLDEATYWLWFHRSQYLVYVYSAHGLTEAAKAVAQEVDRALEAALGGEPDQGPDAGPRADESESETQPDDTIDIAGIFWGTSGLDPLLLGISEVVHCPGRSASDPSYDPRTFVGLMACDGARRAWEDWGAVEDSILKRFPNPTEREKELASQVIKAVFLAGLQGKDGEPLFPSVGVAMPLIKKLADDRTMYTVPGHDSVTAVGRFLELLAARDALGWEKRFPSGADSSSGGGGAP